MHILSSRLTSVASFHLQVLSSSQTGIRYSYNAMAGVTKQRCTGKQLHAPCAQGRARDQHYLSYINFALLFILLHAITHYQAHRMTHVSWHLRLPTPLHRLLPLVSSAMPASHSVCVCVCVHWHACVCVCVCVLACLPLTGAALQDAGTKPQYARHDCRSPARPAVQSVTHTVTHL